MNTLSPALLGALVLWACGLPETKAACTELTTTFTYPGTAITSATIVPAGQAAGRQSTVAVGEHCLVSGRMLERVSAVDGQTYAIGFEMRLPREWNGRFFYQANGGLDGVIVPAFGAVSGGGPLAPALAMGFAVISSDAGHSAAQNPLFGIDPQARLDYGYQAVGKLTPMAKELIRAAYGKTPDYSYIGGCSNGGRHAMVAAARYAEQFDGFLAGNPGFHLPQAAIAQLYGAQQFATVATSRDLNTAFTAAERKLIANEVLEKCDLLDGAKDGTVGATSACQIVFDPARDVPRCRGERDGSCLTDEQKAVLRRVFAGARDSAGKKLYASFPYDPGIAGSNWASWKFGSSVGDRDPLAMAFIFQTPPVAADVLVNGNEFARTFALSFDIHQDATKIFATTPQYGESSASFMAPPDETRLLLLKRTGGKLLVYHGTGDPVFSSDDTAAWYNALTAVHGRSTGSFVRYFEVPGMNHCRGGPAADQFDMITPLVNWVEKGQAPRAVIATARGRGNPGGVNDEVSAAWEPDRTRPLCPYPQIARYKGRGDVNRADNFRCGRHQNPTLSPR
jgi:pimeloyl-ACP methyl ester carboxylesterase